MGGVAASAAREHYMNESRGARIAELASKREAAVKAATSTEGE